MKKIISIVVLFFAFSIGANAQSTPSKKSIKQELETKARKNLADLSQNMDIPSEKVYDELYKVFLKKHTDLATAKTEGDKTQISNQVDASLKQLLNENLVNGLKEIEGLYDKLIK
jgi:type I site-specific restriction endonuclease